jgi:hypothetical protein
MPDGEEGRLEWMGPVWASTEVIAISIKEDISTPNPDAAPATIVTSLSFFHM